MKPLSSYSHGKVIYNEYDIILRHSIVALFSSKLKEIFNSLNPAIKMFQVETPTLTPKKFLKSHEDVGFELIDAGDEYLRPETAGGTFVAFKDMWPQAKQLKKALPVCLWQVGKSYRNEQNRPFGELRFKEFYQLEYQLAYAEDTKADYHKYILDSFYSWLHESIFSNDMYIETVASLPHYSSRTDDIYVQDENYNHEVIAISTRKDFDYPVLEISCGLDRICALKNI